MELNYGEWQKYKNIEYENRLSNLIIRKNKDCFIVQKQIKITSDNDHYAYLELQIMKQIQSPHVVKYLAHTINQKNNLISIYMPYYQHGDLEQYLLAHPNLTIADRVRMFIDILVGLKELHQKLIIHRDLKLKNIFVDEQGRCVVGDIGIAAIMEGSGVSQVGTIPNQAPEVYSNTNYDQKVDVWTMGIIGYQLFNPLQDGKLPFPFQFFEDSFIQKSIRINGGSTDYKRYLEYTEKLRPFDPSVPQNLVGLIIKMLQNARQKRISWIQFYTSGVLLEYDELMRLSAFHGEYKKVSSTKQIIMRYDQYLSEMQINYFEPLQNLLNDKNVQENMKQFPFLKKRKHQLHIFFYFSLRKAIERYYFIKQNRVYSLVRKFKPFVKKYKEIMYNVEQRINVWLRDNEQEEVAKNKKLMSEDYQFKLKKIVDELMEKVRMEEK